MAHKIHKLDLTLHERPFIGTDDLCYYFLEKEAEGFDHSKANNLVYNFKKPVDRKGRHDWKYKVRAIHLFTKMLCSIKYPKNTTIIPAPTSKPRHHAQWDSRIDDAVDGIRRCNHAVAVEKALDTKMPHTPAHSGGSRNIAEIQNNTSYIPLQSRPEWIILVDDVLTTGAHFRAWKEILVRHNPGSKVIGLFLALHMWKSI